MERVIKALTVGAVLALAGTAAAQTRFLATQQNTLFRFGTTGTIDTFTMPDDMVGMAQDPTTGIIYVTSPPTNPGGQGELYRLDNAFGVAPSLTLLSNTMATQYPSISFVGNKLYGFRNTDDVLVEIDLGTFNQTIVGATGATGLDRVGGSGYDAVNDTLYAIQTLTAPNALYTVDYSLSNGPDPSSTFVGNLGVINDSCGADFYNGQLWIAIQNGTSGRFELGTVNTGTGAYSFVRDLGVPALSEETSLLAVPTPGALGLLGLGMLAATRRRR